MTKTFRLTIALVAVAAMVPTTFGSAAQAKSKGTIAILSINSVYFHYGADGAAQAAKALGYNYKIYTNQTGSPAEEVANVDSAIAAGPVAITGYSIGGRLSPPHSQRRRLPVYRSSDVRLRQELAQQPGRDRL